MGLRRLRKEDGISLVMAVGVLMVLSVSGATVVNFSAANERSATHSIADETAFGHAEAGLAEAFSVLNNPDNFALSPFLLPETETEYEKGSATWSGVLDESVYPAYWTITSTGSRLNPTGPAGDVERTLTATVKILPVFTQPITVDVWNYVYVYGVGDPGGCDVLMVNSSEFTSPLYAAGNVCLDNSAKILGGPVQVHGKLDMKGSSTQVGASGAPITNGVHISGGCRHKSGTAPTWQSPCTSANYLYADPPATTSPSLLPQPEPDWSKWYLNASPGPYYPCYTQTGTPPVFDNDQGPRTSPNPAKRNRSVPGSFELTPPGSSYSCKTSAGEISWNHTTKLLTVNGTVYIDGNARIEDSNVKRYTGHGTLFLSGSFVIKGSYLCGKVTADWKNCDWTGWNPNDNLIIVVTEGNAGQSDIPDDSSIDISGSRWQLGLQSPSRLNIGSSAEGSGPVVTGKMTMAQSLKMYDFPVINQAPVAAPGAPGMFPEPQPPEQYGG